jgi:hypothetical protein
MSIKGKENVLGKKYSGTSSKILHTSVYHLNFQIGQQNKEREARVKKKKKKSITINLGRHYDLNQPR